MFRPSILDPEGVWILKADLRILVADPNISLPWKEGIPLEADEIPSNGFL